jgi:protein-L-isoaspartate(D-aspartate) O-methyltransferase
MEPQTRRDAMVRDQIRHRGIRDERILAAFARVPREDFVGEADQDEAYADNPIPIGEGQTISQPYIVARTLEALSLRGDERVLDVGTGSGYAAALLSLLAREVVSIERLPFLAERAKGRLARLGYPVEVIVGDGTLGAPSRAPYDAIAVAACAPRIPPALVSQLAPGGRMVIPVKHGGDQVLALVSRGATANDLDVKHLDRVRFVPLIGEQGEP